MLDASKNEVPAGFVLLQRHDGKPLYAACLDGGRFHGWLMSKHPEGQWVSQRKLESWEVMQSEDQRDYGIVHETAATKPTACALPPTGWTCTRAPGHEGPCAAVATEVCADDYTPEQMVIYQHGVEDGKLVARGMERYKAGIAAREAATKPAAAPEGYKLAPINPTPAMLEAARNAPLPMVRLDSMSAQQDLMNKSRYAAMLAAAPVRLPQRFTAGLPAEGQKTLEDAARKLVTYSHIYTGDKQARRLAVELSLMAEMMSRTPAASTTGAAQTAEQVRDQALEDAAKAAEATRVATVQYGISLFQDGDGTRRDIAEAIRALKRPTPTHSSEAGE